MERLARLLPFRPFGRLRHLRGKTFCHAAAAALTAAPSVSTQGSLLSETLDRPAPMPALPSAQPAFARVSLQANRAQGGQSVSSRAPVRVYHGPSRFIMVGTIDAVCSMIDRCIADESAAALQAGA